MSFKHAASASILQSVNVIFDYLKNVLDGSIVCDKNDITLSILDGSRLLKDLCNLTMGSTPIWLIIERISNSFGLELIEDILTHYRSIFDDAEEFTIILRDRLAPMITRFLESDKRQFQYSVHVLRILDIFIMNYYDLMISTTENLLDKLIMVLEESNEELWFRVLILEVLRNLTSDPIRLYNIYQHEINTKYNITERIGNISGRYIKNMFENNEYSSYRNKLNSSKSSCLDLLSLSGPPEISSSYALSISLDIMSGIIDCIQYNLLNQDDDPDVTDICSSMADSFWPSILSSFSNVIGQCVDEYLLQKILKSYQTFSQCCGIVDLSTPRITFLSSLKKHCIPTGYHYLKFKLPHTFNVSRRNVHSLKTMINIATTPRGCIGEDWGIVLDTIQILNIILNVTPSRDSELNGSDDKILPEETSFLATSLDTLFSTSQVMSLDDLVIVFNNLHSRSQGKLFPESIEEQDMLNAATDNYIEIDGIFEFCKIMDLVEANVERISHLWPSINEHVINVCDHRIKYIRHYAIDRLMKTIEICLDYNNDTIETTFLCSLKAISSTPNADIRSKLLNGLYKLMQTSGHKITEGYPFIISIIKNQITSNKLAPFSKHVSRAFKSLKIICDDCLPNVPLDSFPLLVSTIGLYSTPYGDVNIALESISGLLWNVSSFIANEEEHSGTWILLFEELGKIGICDRSETRKAALRSLFGILSTHGKLVDVPYWVNIIGILEGINQSLADSCEKAYEESINENQEKGEGVQQWIYSERTNSITNWEEARVIAIEGYLQIFKTFFGKISNSHDSVELVCDNILTFVENSWENDSTILKVAAVNALENLLMARKNNKKFPETVWELSWRAYLRMVIYFSNEKVVSHKIVNLLSKSLENIYYKLQRVYTQKEYDILFDIIEPMPLLPVQYAGEITILQKSIMKVLMEIFQENNEYSERIILLLINYVKHYVGIPDEDNHNEVDWSPMPDEKLKPLANRSLKTITDLWDIIPPIPSLVPQLTYVLGRTIQLRYKVSGSNIWSNAFDLFFKVIERGINELPGKQFLSEIEIKLIWTDLLDSIETFLFPSDVKMLKDINETQEQKELCDSLSCMLLRKIILASVGVPDLQPRIVALCADVLSNDSRKSLKDACYQEFFKAIRVTSGNIDEVLPVAKIIYPALMERCTQVLTEFNYNEKNRGAFPITRSQLAEIQMILDLAIETELLDGVTPNQTSPVQHFHDMYYQLCDCMISKQPTITKRVRDIFILLGGDLNIAGNQ
eukprot:TRINITY_DN7553_c0_g1_i1.p1 TRINITY_DN7553_c0_g1~~TRINITY_DN7553_c0_g1_i1.p1  ORF type:complete len:1352 (-),score=254.40 TRINITY_DN7553_c0_g1_i1:69-3842(-)